MNPDRIAVIAFDGISPFHLSVPCIVFGEDRRDMGLPAFDFHVCAVEPGSLRSAAGFGLHVDEGLGALAGSGTVIVPSWPADLPPVPAALTAALRAAHAAGSRIVGLCLGAFVLGEAGLLAGRPATTHWRWAEPFAQRFPTTRVDPRVLYIDDGDIVTSAGTAASLDCCLYLLRQRVGAELSNRLARGLVVPPHRQGNQAQYIEQPVAARPGDERLVRTLEWAAAHLDEPLTVDALARHAAMSRRTFTRHFRRATGATVGEWLTGHRLALAQRLLETSDTSVEQIAGAAGFGTALSLRLHFARAFSISPAAYRREFRGR